MRIGGLRGGVLLLRGVRPSATLMRAERRYIHHRPLVTVVTAVVVILRRLHLLHLTFHRRQHRQLSDAAIDGAETVPAPPVAEPPAELPTKAPVVQDIPTGAATAMQLHGMQRLILAPVPVAATRSPVAQWTLAVPGLAGAMGGTIGGIIGDAPLTCVRLVRA